MLLQVTCRRPFTTSCMSMQECAEDDAVVAGQLADMLNLVRPGDSAWRPDLTAADVAAMGVDEITGRFKVRHPASHVTLHPNP